ncbi:MAG: metallophosphoesterase family protein [Candidatus Hodarchaeota archaeon]
MRSRLLLLYILCAILVSSVTFVSADSTEKTSLEAFDMDAWHFIALGDNRQQLGIWDYERNHYTHDNSSNPIRAALLNSVVDHNPKVEFIVHTGDIVTSGGEQDDWDRYFEDIENVTRNNITIYYAVGNHEYYTYALSPGDWGPNDDDWSTYLANVDLPGNERYYSFDYRNRIHFAFINTEEYWDQGFNISSEQKSWLINDLAANSIDFVVAVFHRPAYSVLRIDRVTEAQAVRDVLEPIFQQYGVDLVFSGHDHYYYRTTRNGITYVTTGGGGAGLHPAQAADAAQTGDVYFSEYHYCKVTVAATKVTIASLIFYPSNQSTALADALEIPLGAEGTEITEIDITETTITEKTTIGFLIVLLAIPLFFMLKKSRKY